MRKTQRQTSEKGTYKHEYNNNPQPFAKSACYLKAHPCRTAKKYRKIIKKRGLSLVKMSATRWIQLILLPPSMDASLSKDAIAEDDDAQVQKQSTVPVRRACLKLRRRRRLPLPLPLLLPLPHRHHYIIIVLILGEFHALSFRCSSSLWLGKYSTNHESK